MRLAYFFVVSLSVTIILSCGSSNEISKNVQSESGKTKIVFLIGEREYNTKETLPDFARRNFDSSQFELVYVHADSVNRNSFPGIVELSSADLLVVSVRRRTLPQEQFSILNDYIWSGKPIVGIRTASHAFELRNEEADEGHQQFKNFDRVVFGGDYEGHYAKDLMAKVIFDRDFLDHPLLDGIPVQDYSSLASLYKSKDLEKNTEAVVWASVDYDGRSRREPVAWTYKKGEQKIFYTSLGHETDFEQEYFQILLRNAINWAL